MINDLICPISYSIVDNKFIGRLCIKEKCAWFCNDTKVCAVPKISEELIKYGENTKKA